MRLCALAITTCLIALPAAAQSQLERMEALSEEANRITNAYMIAQLPALDGNMPDPEWDDPMRSAFTCVLDGYRADAGDAGIDRMLEDMETTMAELSPEALMNGGLQERVQLPDGVSEARSVELMNTCRVMELYMARMRASGALTILSQQ